MDQEILSEARDILGPPVKVNTRRGWATWWCPFHDDEGKHGKSKRPNFGVHLAEGYWKCLRCGKSGGSLYALRRELGLRPKDRRPVPVPVPEPEPNPVPLLGEALSVARHNFRDSPARKYAISRGVSPRIAMLYGLGVGPGRLSKVSPGTIRAALKANLVSDDTGWWKWDRGVVYADPPTAPDVIQVRHLRKTRLKYQTWGEQIHPYGAWRISSKTETLISVEGMFDMLVLASVIEQRGLSGKVVPLYTGGATPSFEILEWYAQAKKYRHILIPDVDEAGMGWMDTLSRVLHDADLRVCIPPGELDPDEALLSGWWPESVS